MNYFYPGLKLLFNFTYFNTSGLPPYAYFSFESISALHTSVAGRFFAKSKLGNNDIMCATFELLNMIASCSRIEPSKIFTILDWPSVLICASYNMKDKLKILNINCWCLTHFHLYGFNTFISHGTNCLKSRGRLTWFLFIWWNAYNDMGPWQITSLCHTQIHPFISRKIHILGTNSIETSKKINW